MAYFLGRDVNVYITTETGVTNKAIGATGSAASDATLVAGAPSGIVNLFADDMNSGAAIAGYTAYADITGVEVALGTMDEDTSFIGQVQPGKVEIKKEYTVSLTRKKKNNLWDIIFNGDGTNTGRFGLGNGTSGLGTGKVNPKSIVDSSVTTASCYGYRVHLQFKTGSAGSQANEEMICMTNCCITGYTTTLNADGVQEETLEFTSYQPARYPQQADEIYVTLTPTAGF
tara:strand:+ start:4191 stop:4877 length:687 start_codon:yes stop_codon:yes gene_type:complete